MSNPSSVGPSSAGASQAGMGSKPTSGNGAAKVFKEFKWGLLTLFLLMAVVIGLVYDGGKKKVNTTGVKPIAEAPVGGTDLAGSNLGMDNTYPLNPGSGMDTMGNPAAGMPGNTGVGGSNVAPGNEYAANPADPIAQPGRPGKNDPYAKVDKWREDRSLPFVPTQPPEYPAGGAKDTTKKVADKKTTKPGEKTEKTGTESTPATDTYKVASGDTLSGIASKLFPGRAKTGLKALMDSNKNIDPNKMRVGQVLKVPTLAPEKGDGKKVVAVSSKTSAEPTEAAPEHMTMGEKEEHAKDMAAKKSTASTDTYEVAAGDTLEKIASKVYHDRSRWQEIYDLNKDKLHSPSSIRVGQKLKLKGASEATEAKASDKPEKTTGKKHSTVAQADLSGIEGVQIIGLDSKPEVVTLKAPKETAKHTEPSPASTVWMP